VGGGATVVAVMAKLTAGAAEAAGAAASDARTTAAMANGVARRLMRDR
jgi:hypothetical protein